MAQLYDIIVRHQVYLEGLKLGTAKNFNLTALELNKSIRAELADLSYDNLGDMSKRALSKLIAVLKRIARTVFTAWLTDLIRFLQDFTRDDLELFRSVLIGSDEIEEEPEEEDPEKSYNGFMLLPMGANGILPHSLRSA